MPTEKLAIAGGAPVRTAPFPAWPIFDAREEQALLGVLHSRKWGMHIGAQVTEFERRFAAFQGARFGVCVPNGTLALEMALRALGVGPGAEVITSPYTFYATASSIMLVGGRPVFADIEPDSYCLDPTAVEAAITPRTRAIVPVHLGGRPADMDALLEIARRHGLGVLEDACQAWGAEWRGRPVGALGDIGAFSFQASKNITSGEGGIAVTNDPALAEFCWSFHTCGRTRGGAWYEHEHLGTNFRLAEWEGALLLVQLERLPEHMPVREANAQLLARLLEEVGGLSPLPDDERVTSHGRHLFIARYRPEAFGGHSRRDFIEALRAEGISPCSPGYIPLHRTPAVRRTLAQRHDVTELPPCPVAERAAQEAVWFFQYALLGEASDMESIAEAVAKIRRAWG